MKKRNSFIVLSVLTAAIAGCHSSSLSSKEYKAKINQWHQQRVKKLTQKDGWLTLAGLFWLQPGCNRFGSDSSNDVIFPNGESPPHIGAFILQDSSVHISVRSGVSVTADNHPVNKMKLQPDVSGEPTILHLKSLSWYIIKRGDKIGVRLKDSTNKIRENFNGIERFSVNRKWQIKATFIPFDSVHTMKIPSVIGQQEMVKVPGKLIFHINGKSLSLLPMLESKGAKKWFIVFGDKTNGKTTHGGGRFLYVNRVKGGQTTYIDFNKAYDPPCSFTKFATCPLPPPQNELPVAVKAGEKAFTGNSIAQNDISENTLF
jgi:uncharacterized protein (DUF1684 family)